MATVIEHDAMNVNLLIDYSAYVLRDIVHFSQLHDILTDWPCAVSHTSVCLCQHSGYLSLIVLVCLPVRSSKSRPV